MTQPNRNEQALYDRVKQDGPAVDRATGEILPVPFSLTAYLAGRSRELRNQQALAAAYDEAVAALIGPNDVQESGGRTYKKKSAFCKLARHFGISTSLVSVATHEIAGGHLHARVVVRGEAPWGQTVECVGGCSTEEERFQKSSRSQRTKARHDCEATAETRATNRAISRLIAAGEVSAEELGEAPERGAKAIKGSRGQVPVRRGSPTKELPPDALAPTEQLVPVPGEPWPEDDPEAPAQEDPLMLPGKATSWGGNGGKLLSECPSSVLVAFMKWGASDATRQQTYMQELLEAEAIVEARRVAGESSTVKVAP